jgi:hypothetical protein
MMPPGGVRNIGWRLIHQSAWRDCMKSGSRVVIRYSSTHEKDIPDGSFRRRMELLRASHASSQRIRTAQGPRSSRDPKRRLLLRPQKRLPVAPTAARLSYRWPTLYHYFRKWRIDGTWERINRAIRERLRVRSGRDPQPSAGVVDSQGRSRAPGWAQKIAVTTEARRSRAF